MLSQLLEDHARRRELERQEAEAGRAAQMWSILRQAVTDPESVAAEDLDALAEWADSSRIDVDSLESAILHAQRLQHDCANILELRRKMSVISIRPNIADRQEIEQAWAKAFEAYNDWQGLHRQLPALIPAPPVLPELLEV